VFEEGYGMSDRLALARKVGVCVPWEEKRPEFPEILGNEDLVARVWTEIEGLGNMFIWHCLLSF
jgi:hypothetical protein